MAGISRIEALARELGQVSQDMIDRKYRTRERWKLIRQRRSVFLFHDPAPARGFKISEAMNESGRGQTRDAAKRPARPKERKLARFHIGRERLERVRRFLGGSGVVQNTQSDGGNDYGARGELSGTLDIVNLAGQMLHQGGVIEGMNLRIVGITNQRGRVRPGTTAVDLGEEIGRGRSEENSRRVGLQRRPDALGQALRRWIL